MKGLKLFAICAAVILLLAPATAMAKGPRFSISLNFFDSISALLTPPPPPVMRERVLVPYPLPPPYVERHTVVKEYYYGCDCPGCCETIRPLYPHRPFYPY